MSDESGYAVVMTTVAGAEAAEELARKVLAAGLAACVQSLRIHSWYKWKGETCSEPEHLLLVKTRAALFDELAAFIRANHSYETPEIVRLPIDRGLPGYLRWIDAQTGG